MTKLLWTAVLLFAALLAQGKVFYVSNTGSDRNPGTQKSPWRTIGFAARKAGPGDTVKIAPGLYREQVTFNRSGKKGAPITFQGTRGADGSFLTVVEGVGTTLANWVPAPEIAPDVWKTDLKERPHLVMMDGKMIVYINSKTMALPRRKKLPDELNDAVDGASLSSRFGPGCKRCPGFDLLALKKDIRSPHPYLGNRKELLWPTIGNVMAGWSNGKLYVRFADGGKPQQHSFTASRGAGFSLKKASFLTFRDLHMRGSRVQFYLYPGSCSNIIDNCMLMHGGARVRIRPKAENNTVQNCILTAGFIRGDLFKLRASDDMRGGVLYRVFKFIVGDALSDDVGINDRGRGTKMLNNVILQGLIGTDAYGVDCEFAGNVIMGMSSVGLRTGPRTVGKFHHNIIMNAAIPLRIHDYRAARAKREEYHYKNLFIQAPKDGQQVFVHCESHAYGPDKVNFEPGTRKYKKNPPAPVDAGKFYIYHNTFWGGARRWAVYTVGALSQRFNRTRLPFHFVNNIARGSHNWNPFAQVLQTGNLLYGYPNDFNKAPLRYPTMVEDNKYFKPSTGIWNDVKMPGFLDLTLAKNSPALGIGIDISRPFTFKGQKFPAFPGFKPGYFKGKAPAAGALQEGESQEYYTALFRRTQKAVELIRNSGKITFPPVKPEPPRPIVDLIRDGDFSRSSVQLKGSPWVTSRKIKVQFDKKSFIKGGAAIVMDAQNKDLIQWLEGLEPGTRYRLSFHLKLEDVKKLKEYAGFSMMAGFGNNRSYRPFKTMLSGSAPWKEYVFEFTTPETLVKPSVWFFFRNASGRVLIDNVKLVEIQ